MRVEVSHTSAAGLVVGSFDHHPDEVSDFQRRRTQSQRFRAWNQRLTPPANGDAPTNQDAAVR